MNNKDSSENKVELDIRKAMAILFAGIESGLVEVPTYETRNIEEDEAQEDILMEEILFMVKHAKKDLRSKRIRMFFVGPFFIPRDIRSAMKKQYKECKVAYKYLLKNKKDLRRYMSIVKLGTIIDPQSTWLSPTYHSGDNVSRRIPVYDQITSNFLRYDALKTSEEKWEKRHVHYTEDQEKALLTQGASFLEVVCEEMSKETTGPFKGEAEFRSTFKQMVDKLIKQKLQMSTWSLSTKTKVKWVSMSDKAMWAAWKKRLECTEKSKSSSKQKDDDSQS